MGCLDLAQGGFPLANEELKCDDVRALMFDHGYSPGLGVERCSSCILVLFSASSKKSFEITLQSCRLGRYEDAETRLRQALKQADGDSTGPSAMDITLSFVRALEVRLTSFLPANICQEFEYKAFVGEYSTDSVEEEASVTALLCCRRRLR